MKTSLKLLGLSVTVQVFVLALIINTMSNLSLPSEETLQFFVQQAKNGNNSIRQAVEAVSFERSLPFFENQIRLVVLGMVAGIVCSIILLFRMLKQTRHEADHLGKRESSSLKTQQ